MELCSVGKPSFFVVILLLWFQFCAVHSRPTTSATSLPQNTTNGSLTSTEAHSESEGKKIKVAKFDFKYIATPFIVSVWVLLASLLKVGTFKYFKYFSHFKYDIIALYIQDVIHY
jgi:hypothetical protein